MNENIVVCHYRVKPGAEKAFEALLQRHWPTLHRLGFVTDDPAVHYKGTEEGGPLYIEIFEWCAGAFSEAHTHPEVMAIWEPMDQLTEKRAGRPNMEFPHMSRLHVQA